MIVEPYPRMTEPEKSPRGRRRGREENGELMMNGSSSPAPEGDDDLTPGSSKKRRRSRKAHSDKKFDCKHEGCGKSYSRAEHLYRHQLNHTPKHIYRCDYPDCTRAFVRQDLCVRHRERHTTHGSQLHRRDNFAQGTNTTEGSGGQESMHGPNTQAPQTESLSSPEIANRPKYLMESPTTTRAQSNSISVQSGHSSSRVDSNASTITTVTTPLDTSQFQPPTPQTVTSSSDRTIKRSDSNSSYPLSPQRTQPIATYNPSQRHASFGSIDSQRFHPSPTNLDGFGRPGLQTSMPPSLMRSDSMSTVSTPVQPYQTPMSMSNMPAPGNNSFVPQQNFPRLTSLPPPGFSAPSLPRTSSANFATTISQSLSALESGSSVLAPGSTADMMDHMTPYTYPVFGGETYNRSPFAMADDFAAWLFNDAQGSFSSPMGYPMSGPMGGYVDPMSGQYPGGSYYPNDGPLGNYFSSIVPPQHPMTVISILDTGPPQSIMSEEKRQELLDIITTRFNESNRLAEKSKDEIMEGNMEDEEHILSLRMIQTYIGSFWYHCHSQLPILHKPTFAADKTPNLLLLAVVAIGASTLDKVHGHELTDAAADFANFIAWHLRGEIFKDADFQPPAKLWVFQALILLEVYEKMYATRALHERAHIHHDTTLTLMRRGSSLIGRSAYDSPPSVRDDKVTRSATGSSSTSESGVGDESWGHWIRNEATRRAAFAAFVLDSTHATMFGHSAKMVAHEMRLPLPCDEALWSATSAAEVARVQASLHANGIKPTMFLDGLKKTLNAQKVRTNSFGRTILMAGLLSVSWHMNQRDLQVSSLGVSQALGGRDKWRSALLRAFDYWLKDFDEALAELPADYASASPYRTGFRPMDEENIFESRTVLHHLAHMASHVDVVDCQIFAGASRLLGRSISPRDYAAAKEKMTERWATKASARDATFYALKFLSQVLIPDDAPVSSNATGRPSNGIVDPSDPAYSARDDFLLNRPWVMYLAALVVWSYGFALDGPITAPLPDVSTPAAQERDMRAFLERVGGVLMPNDLDEVRGRNRCLGLLMVLRERFRGTRWELLHESGALLESCCEKLKGN